MARTCCASRTKTPCRGWLVRRALAACDRLVPLSPLLGQAAVALGLPEERIVSIPWGIDTGIFRPGPDDRLETRQALGLPPAERLILCPRSPAPLYRLREVALAFGSLARERPALRLALLNYNPDPAYVQALKTLVTDLGLQAQVTWLPAQPDPAAMARLYRASDLVVSVPETEGLGLSVYEALACGCPTIISDLPVFKGVIQAGTHALAVPVGDEEALAGALARLLDDPELSRKLSENGARLAGGMSDRHMADQAEALYAGLAA